MGEAFEVLKQREDVPSFSQVPNQTPQPFPHTQRLLLLAYVYY
jgi:hypothetical protein